MKIIALVRLLSVPLVLCMISCGKVPDNQYYIDYWSTLFYAQNAINAAQGYSKSIDPSAFDTIDQFLSTHKSYRRVRSYRGLKVLRAFMKEQFGEIVEGVPIENSENLTGVPKEDNLISWVRIIIKASHEEMNKNKNVDLDTNSIKAEILQKFQDTIENSNEANRQQ